MKKIRNNKQKFTLMGYEIEEGLNFMPQDFFDLLTTDPTAENDWKQLLTSGAIEVVAD